MTEPARIRDSGEFDELARVRAAREALAKAREERERAEEPARRLAAEKLALANEEAIDAAEQKEGPVGKRIGVVNTDLGVVIMKRPHAAVFRKFQDRGKTDSKSLVELVRPCLVHPSLDEFERVCDELPATLVRCADVVSGLAGVRAEDLAGKL